MDIDLKKLSSKINVDLNNDKIEKFNKYMDLLLEWNEKINLTAITEKNDIVIKHFIDSMTVLKYIDNGNNIVDVGTGAGFPGIPIAIANNDVNVTLVDSLNKRVMFLEDVVSNINLKNVKTIHSRAEDFGQNNEFREKYDIAVSRAVANLSVLVEYLLPLIKIGGKCICMKGSEVEGEISNAKFAINVLGGKIESVDDFCLPGTDIKRNIIIIRKEKDTPKKYPRKAGMPSKSPLK